MLEILKCKHCGSEDMTKELFCVQCGADRRPPVCPHCFQRHYSSNECDREALIALDEEKLLLMDLVEEIDEDGGTIFDKITREEVWRTLKNKIKRQRDLR